MEQWERTGRRGGRGLIDAVLIAIPAGIAGPLAGVPIARLLISSSTIARAAPRLQPAASATVWLASAAVATASVAIIALPWLQRLLRSGQPVSTGLNGTLSADPVLVLAPVLMLIAGALLTLRALPMAARLADHAAARGRGMIVPVAAWQISRRTLRQTGPSLVAVLAVAAAVMTMAQRYSWQRSVQAQASFNVGADARLSLPPAAPASMAQAGRNRLPADRWRPASRRQAAPADHPDRSCRSSRLPDHGNRVLAGLQPASAGPGSGHTAGLWRNRAHRSCWRGGPSVLAGRAGRPVALHRQPEPWRATARAACHQDQPRRADREVLAGVSDGRAGFRSGGDQHRPQHRERGNAASCCGDQRPAESHRAADRRAAASQRWQQRVGIARALAADAALLLADEPTGQLDSRTGRQIMALLRSIVHGQGQTAIVTTHDRALMDIADRVLMIRNGRLS